MKRESDDKQVRSERIILLVLLMATLLLGGWSEDATSASLRIEVGDRVTITVYDEPDLDVKGFKVPKSGRVSVPLIGNINVLGKSESEVTTLVTGLFADGYLKRPRVTVSVERIQLYFIKGEVRQPGGYRFVEGLSIQKAIALAGGYTERAAEEDISVVSESKPGRSRTRVSPAAAVAPGDIITIGESFF